MAEYCLECWNKINDTKDKESKYIMSDEADFCDGCGEWKRVIVAEKKGRLWIKLINRIVNLKRKKR